MNGLNPYVRIVLNSEQGKGVVLSVQEVVELALDNAIEKVAHDTCPHPRYDHRDTCALSVVRSVADSELRIARRRRYACRRGLDP